MNSPPETTYGFLRMDERYKKLERAIKMLQIKQLEKKIMHSCAPDPGINISSINGDVFDSSCAFSSKLGSEVVSSSTNMRNLIAHKMKTYHNNNNIVTSSVKASPDNDEARANMPPPKNIPILAHSSRKNTFIKSSCSIQEALPPKHATSAQDDQKRVLDTNKPDRIFEQWKVMINDKGQLVIKGTLKGCEKTVRSKPVIRRLNSVTVQSCYNHIYELQGRIHDDQHELPDYIRGRFYNGFPDDWENVYQLWRSYISGGCKPTFRWPTAVADSDDDLKSDITELTYHKEEKKSHGRVNSYKNRCETIVSSEKRSETSSEKPLSRSPVKKLESQTSPSSKIHNASNKSPKTSQNRSAETNDTSEKITTFLNQIHNIHFNNSSSTNNTLDDEISNAISKILTSKNFSVEYIDKIIDMFNYYKYIVMSKPLNSSPIITIDNQVSSAAEKVPSRENVIKDPNITYSKSEIHQNSTPQDLNQYKDKQNHDYNFGSISKLSNTTSTVKNIGKVRRKLSRRDYDSSEVSDSDSEVERQKVKSSRKNLKSHSRRMPGAVSIEKQSVNHNVKMMKKYKFKHQFNDDSDDDFVPKRTKYQSLGYNNLNKSVKDIGDQVDVVKHPEVFKRPVPQVQHKNTLQDHRNLNSSSKHHRERNTSPSTITEFLRNYDSCVSFSEDDRSKFNNKKIVTKLEKIASSPLKPGLNQAISNHYYDSCISFTEDERQEVNNRVNRHDLKKQVLQESNVQCFQQMLKRNLKHNPSNFALLDKKHNPQGHQEVSHGIKKQCSSLQNRDPKEFAYAKHVDVHLNDNKENKLDQAERDSPSHQRPPENHEMNVNKQEKSDGVFLKQHSPKEKKKPTIISVEEVSIDINPYLPKKSHRDEANKSRSPENQKMKSNLGEEDKKYTKTSEKNLSLGTYRLDLSSKSMVKCRDLSIKLEDIKNAMKDKYFKEKKNADISSERVIFGTEENPKKLTKWIPKVLEKSDSNYGLVFEGKLLNEAGHVESKKFTTDFIARRVSLKVVETEKHEFYQLIGDLTDTKYIVPKDLYKLCLNGCPSKISQFCEKWRNKVLEDFSVSKQALNSTIDIMNIPQSSRGRRILPPLSYWEGERIIVKDNHTVYNPGSPKGSLVYSPYETSIKNNSNNSSRNRNSSTKGTTTSTKKSSSNVEKKEKEKNSSNERGNNFDEKDVENKKEFESLVCSSYETSRKDNLQNSSRGRNSSTKGTTTSTKKSSSNVEKKEKEKNSSNERGNNFDKSKGERGNGFDETKGERENNFDEMKGERGNNFDEKDVENKKEFESLVCSSYETSRKNNLQNSSRGRNSSTKGTTTSTKKHSSNVDEKEKEKNKEKNSSKERETNFDEKTVVNKRQLRESSIKCRVKKEIKLRRSYRSRKERIKIKDMISTESDSSSEDARPISKRRRRGSNARKKESSHDDEQKRSNFDKDSPNNSNGVTVKYYKKVPYREDNDFSDDESNM